MCMALRAHGVDCNEDEVNKVMGARPMQGATWENALACAQHYGFRATLVTPSTVQQLKEWTDAGDPVMIAWNPEGRDWSHASLVFDVDDDLNVHVADPNLPDPEETVRVVPKGEFYKKWFEKWPNYLVRRPACAIQREISTQGRQIFARFQPQGVQARLIRDGIEVSIPVTRDIQPTDARKAIPLLSKHVGAILAALRESGFEARNLGWALTKNPPSFSEKIEIRGSNRRARELENLLKSFSSVRFMKSASNDEYVQSVLNLEAAMDDVQHVVNRMRSMGIEYLNEDYPFLEDIDVVASDVTRWRQEVENTQSTTTKLACRVARRFQEKSK